MDFFFLFLTNFELEIFLLLPIHLAEMESEQKY